jgi:hypothetical protein
MVIQKKSSLYVAEHGMRQATFSRACVICTVPQLHTQKVLPLSGFTTQSAADDLV